MYIGAHDENEMRIKGSSSLRIKSLFFWEVGSF